VVESSSLAFVVISDLIGGRTPAEIGSAFNSPRCILVPLHERHFQHHPSYEATGMSRLTAEEDRGSMPVRGT